MTIGVMTMIGFLTQSKTLCTSCLKTVTHPSGEALCGTCGCGNPKPLVIHHWTRTPSPSASKSEWAKFVVKIIHFSYWWRFRTIYKQIASRTNHLHTRKWGNKTPVAVVKKGDLVVLKPNDWRGAPNYWNSKGELCLKK